MHAVHLWIQIGSTEQTEVFWLEAAGVYSRNQLRFIDIYAPAAGDSSYTLFPCSKALYNNACMILEAFTARLNSWTTFAMAPKWPGLAIILEYC